MPQTKSDKQAGHLLCPKLQKKEDITCEMDLSRPQLCAANFDTNLQGQLLYSDKGI